MAKRFTDTTIWDREWFMLLRPVHKCLMRYLFDNCDAAGVWSPNWILASTHIGEKITVDDLKNLPADQYEFLAGGKLFLPGFIEFQYGELSEKCKPHQKVLSLLRKHNLTERVSQRVPDRVSYTLEEKEEEKDKDKEEEEEKDRGVQGGNFSDYEIWTQDVISGNDWKFTDKLRNMGITVNGELADLARSHLALLAKYPKMQPPDQNRFRISLIGHIQERNKDSPKGNQAVKKFTIDELNS